MTTTSASAAGDEDRKRADVFFERGRIVAQTGNFEYAIEMYIQGLELAPQAMDAHAALRDLSLVRKARGGKDMGMFDKMKMPKARDDKQKMLSALKLLAYSPGDTSRIRAVEEAARSGGFSNVAEEMGKLLKSTQAPS